MDYFLAFSPQFYAYYRVFVTNIFGQQNRVCYRYFNVIVPKKH